MPGDPGAWLLTVARRRTIDALRRDKPAERKHEEWARDMQDRQEQDPAEIRGAIDDAGDVLLDLIFTACHPDLPLQSRAALTLRVIGGLTTEEIARAFLSSETAVAQRIVRAKRFLAATGATFAIPDSSERRRRFATVFEVVYLMFNEGYAATAGEHLVRLPLCAEAQRLGRPNSPTLSGCSRSWSCRPRDCGPELLMTDRSFPFRSKIVRDGIEC